VPKQKQDDTDWFGLTGGILHIGESLGASVPGVGLAFGLAGGAVQIASAFSTSGGDHPEIPIPDQIRFKAADIGATLNGYLDQLAKSLPFVRDLILSDYTKLNTANDRISKGDRGWDLERSQLQTEVLRGLQTSAKQQMWAALLPTAYPNLWQLRDTSWKTPPGCGRHIPRSDYYQTVVDYPFSYNVPGRNTKVVTAGDDDRKYPPEAAVDPLFKPVEPDGGLGLYKPFFYQQNFASKSRDC
jgi:hypothetical protein